MGDSYFTICKEGEGQLREKMSRFIAYACKIKDADEARQIIKRYQNEYHDARHVCWAYMIGPSRSEWQLNDNGEPSGTAGKPILGQINSRNLTDVLVVVVRYLGGIKLGTPGLIAAYRAAAKEAIEAAQIITLHETAVLSFTYPYMVINDVMKLSRLPGVETLSSEFDNTCSMSLRVTLDNAPMLESRLAAIDGLTFDKPS